MLLRTTIYQMMRDAILTNELLPGQEVREQVLAEQYRVSRSPVRDALLRLEVEHLATVLPRQGYRIRPIDLADVEDVFDLRLLVEPACAAKASRADNTGLATLDRFRGSVDADRTMSEYMEQDTAFHIAIADLCGNPRMTAIAKALTEQIARLRQLTLHSGDHEAARRDCAEHGAIIDALQALQASRASELCYLHAKAAHERVLAALQRHAAEEDGRTGPR